MPDGMGDGCPHDAVLDAAAVEKGQVDEDVPDGRVGAPLRAVHGEIDRPPMARQGPPPPADDYELDTTHGLHTVGSQQRPHESFGSQPYSPADRTGQSPHRTKP